jgi:hypothetical protein
MNGITDFFKWLFTDRTGVLVLLVGGIVLFFIISAVLEVRTRARYKNHEKSPVRQQPLLDTVPQVEPRGTST